MAFDADKFSPVGGMAGATNSTISVYSFKTDDDIAVVRTAGYFNALRDELYANDEIIISGRVDHHLPNSRQFYILSILASPRSPSTSFHSDSILTN